MRSAVRRRLEGFSEGSQLDGRFMDVPEIPDCMLNCLRGVYVEVGGLLEVLW